MKEKPNKTEPNRTRLTVGGNLIDFEGKVSTRTAKIQTIKTLLNSILSTKGAKFMTADVNNFYLNTPLGKGKEEYMRMQVKFIPEEIIEEYNLRSKVDNKGWVYMKICKGMYGLPQAGILENELLQKHLNK